MPASVFPPTGGGSGIQLPLNPLAVYVDANGNNTNGTSWANAFTSVSPALDALEAAGGGELHIYSPSGNITNTKLWFRGDGLSVPGWHGDFPLRVIGYGPNQESFGSLAALVHGGSNTDQETPILWLSGTFAPKEFYNLGNVGYPNHAWRLGWDYRRDLAGNIVRANVLSWTRSGTSANVTLALPPPAGVATFSRTGGSPTVTLDISATDVPRAGMCNIWAGMVVRIASTDPNFDSGDFVVSTVPRTTPTPTYQITYNQHTSTGSGPITASNAGTIQWSGLGVGDRFQLTSNTNPNVPSSTYQVTAMTSTADQVVVSDVYGGHIYSSTGIYNEGTYPTSGTWTNIGAWTLEDRYSFNYSVTDFFNCQPYGAGRTYDVPMVGPFVDIGNSNDSRQRWYRCSPNGYALQGPDEYAPDPDRVAWMLVDSGSHGSPNTGELYDTRPGGSGIRMYGSLSGNTSSARIINMLADVPFGNNAPPAFEVLNGGGSGFYYLEGIRIADSISSINVKFDRAGQNTIIVNCGGVYAPGALVIGNDPDLYLSNWVKGQHGFYATSAYNNDQRLAVDLAHVRRNAGVVPARFQNYTGDEPTWTLLSNTATPCTDPFGGNRAWQINGTQDFRFNYFSSAPAAVGDKWVFGVWMRRPGSTLETPNFSVYNSSGPVAGPAYCVAYPGDGGWDFMVGSLSVTDLKGGTGPSIVFGVPPHDGQQVYQPFALLIPASLGMSDGDIAEYIGTVVQMPHYLQPGTVGTQDGVILIGHGGLGSSKHYVSGVSSGQITVGSANGKYMELFDETGASLGVVPFSSFTVNP